MRNWPCLVSRCATLILSASLAMAQAKPLSKRTAGATSSSAYKLLSVKVVGTNHYTANDVIAAAGLKIGSNVGDENFKDATQKLGETGLFTDVAYSFAFSPAGTKLELQVKENDQLIPLVFDNFPWYADQEMIDKIHAEVPLFRGQIPLTGSLVDQVADVVAAIAVQKNPQFHSTYLRAGDGDGPVTSIVFSLSGAQITIRNVEFPGADPAQFPTLANVAKRMAGGEYLRSALSASTKVDLQPVFLRQGYLQATFATPQAQVVTDQPDETIVDVKIPVNLNRQYKLSKAVLTGNTTFSTDKLQPLIHLTPGQPANVVQLSEDLALIRRVYSTRGYVRATTQVAPELNEADGTVSYTVSIKEGALYRMGQIEFEGVDDKTKARLREDWKLQPGDPYDAAYSKRFISDSAAHLPPGEHFDITVHESVDDKEKTVDVTMRYILNR